MLDEATQFWTVYSVHITFIQIWIGNKCDDTRKLENNCNDTKKRKYHSMQTKIKD